MVERCTSPRYARYDLYGGRGIKVTERWLGEDGFANFLADMGKKPTPKHTVDRIDRDGDYEPTNCRWATQAEQMAHVSSNHMVTINGVSKHIGEWCREYGVNPGSVHTRLALGWDAEKAITTPMNRTGVNFTHRRALPVQACRNCGEPTASFRRKFCSSACYLKYRWGYAKVT